MKISAYTSAFNIVQNGFIGWEKSLQLSSELADEVVVCVNKSEDDTVQAIQSLGLENLKVVEADISYEDPLLDGKVKNTALQACSGDILIQLDLDEYIPKSQHGSWRMYAEHLLHNKDFDCYMLPVVNLYKDWNAYKDIGVKWYMHKRGFHRGPVGFARKADGTVDTKRSDTCELIDDYGLLVRSKVFPNNLATLREDNVFVVHFGYLDLESRVERNQKFWKEHWKREAGGAEPPHKVHMSVDEFNEPCFTHNLDI
jgi:glycosyltransferase involved in cell wall biosynthesis